MAREFSRSDRVADAIQRSLAHTIQTEIRDPRLGMVNINAVDVTRDLANAKVYVTFVGMENDATSEASVEILNNAASYLRNLIAKDLSLRTTPRIKFYYDKTAVHGQTLANLIDRAVAEDKSHHRDNEPSESEKGN